MLTAMKLTTLTSRPRDDLFVKMNRWNQNRRSPDSARPPAMSNTFPNLKLQAKHTPRGPVSARCGGGGGGGGEGEERCDRNKAGSISPSPPFFKVSKSTDGLNTVPFDFPAKLALYVQVSVSLWCGEDSIISGGGGGGGGGSGGGGGEGDGKERFDRNKVVPMLGSPEMGRELDNLLKQLGGYELIAKWLIFRRLKLQKGVSKEPLLADDFTFLAPIFIGYAFWLFSKVMARVAVTRLMPLICYHTAPATVSLWPLTGVNAGILNSCPDNTLQVMGIVADIMLSFIAAPTSLSLHPPIGVDVGSIAQIFLVCLQKAYQVLVGIGGGHSP